MPNNSFSNQELIERLQQSDAGAFRILYESYAPRLQAFSTRFKLTPEEAGEIVQETFIRIWLHRHKIDSRASFNTYLITIAKNIIYNQLKKSAHRARYLRELSARVQLTEPHAGHERELQQLIGKTIQQLPDKCRQVFRKSRLEGYTNQQIADELSISRSTVENQLNKALRIIRKSLEENGYRTTLVVGGLTLVTRLL